MEGARPVRGVREVTCNHRKRHPGVMGEAHRDRVPLSIRLLCASQLPREAAHTGGGRDGGIVTGAVRATPWVA